MIEHIYGRAAENRGLRLETLIRLRWVAIAGQCAAVFVVAYGLGFELPLSACMALIAASAWLNVFLRLRYPISLRLPAPASMALLAYDIAQLALLLYATGGLQNPFAMLLIVPVVVSAATQSLRQIVPLGALVMLSSTALVYFHLPLPWIAGQALQLPLAYVGGVWVAIASMLVFTAIYAYRVAEEARQLSNALAATELVLQREQHVSTLDGLAAAAAHELGTPLATIALVSKEMMRELEDGSALKEDAELLRSQAERCRGILRKLTSLSDDESHLGRLPLSSLMEEVAAPHRGFDVAIEVGPGAVSGEPVFARNPGILYGLGNLVENAADFAESRVEFSAFWDAGEVKITINDDGPGFPVEVLERIGEPYVSSRRREQDNSASGHGGGLGLGLFIAKTLLERSGASLQFGNERNGGARITIRWSRSTVDLKNAQPEVETR